MTQYAFHFDATRCTGCKTCEFSCKDYKDLGLGVAYRKVYECAGGETLRDADGCFKTTCFSYPVSISCNHCDHPSCTEVCPTGAMHKDVEDMEKLGERANIAPLPEASLTTPNLFVKACADAQPSDSRAGKIVNPLEVL